MKLGYIYVIEDLLTGMLYVGQTTRIRRRRKDYATGQALFYIGNAIRKRGWDNFTFNVIETVPVEALDAAERYWIGYLQTEAPYGYNLTEGGEGATPSPETLEKMRRSQQARVIDGTHNWLGPNSNQKRIDDGTHNFLREEHSKEVSEFQKQRFDDGTHPFLHQENPVHKQIEEGTHNFLTNHPMRDGAVQSRKQRTQRKNRGILDWVDQLEEAEEDASA